MKHLQLFFILTLAVMAGCGGPRKFIETEADPASLALDAREQYLYVACEGAEKVIAWDVKKRERLQDVDVETGPVRLYLDPDNHTLRVLCKKDKKLIVLQVPEMKKLGTLALPDEPNAMAVRDVKQLLFCSADSDLIRPYVQKNPMPTIPAGMDPQDMLIQPETDLLWVANDKTHSVSVIDLDRNSLVQESRVWPNPKKILSTPMGDQIFVLCTGRDQEPPRSAIQLMDPFYKKPGLTWQAGPAALDAVVDSLGRNIYVLEAGKIRVIATKTGEQIAEITTVKQPNSLVVSPDGLRVYVSDAKMHTVVIHKLKKKQLTGQ